MCETEYENENKAILESCCKVISKAVATYTYKENKLATRRRIEELNEIKRLKDDMLFV